MSSRHRGLPQVTQFLGDAGTDYSTWSSEIILLLEVDGTFGPIAAAFRGGIPGVALGIGGGSSGVSLATALAAGLSLAGVPPVGDEGESSAASSGGPRQVAPSPLRPPSSGAAGGVGAAAAAGAVAAFTHDEDRRARAIILLNIQPELRAGVLTTATALEAWTILAAEHQDQTMARHDEVYNSFISAKMGPQEGIKAFSNRLQAMSRELEQNGGAVNTRSVVTQFLRGVHQRYEFERGYWKMQDAATLTLTKVLPPFLRAEAEALAKGALGQASGSRVPPGFAHLAEDRGSGSGSSSGGGRSGGGRSGGSGSRSGQRHRAPPGYKALLPHRPPGGGGTACHNCGKEGHRWFDCPTTPKYVLANVGHHDDSEEEREFREWQAQRRGRGGGGSVMGADDVTNLNCFLSPATASYLSASRTHKPPGWAIDSGCTRDMTWDRGDFTGPLRPLRKPINILFGDGARANCTHEGTVHIAVPSKPGRDGKGHTLILPRVLYIPRLAAKLLSVVQHESQRFTFHEGQCVITCPIDGATLATGTRAATGLYLLDQAPGGTAATAVLRPCGPAAPAVDSPSGRHYGSFAAFCGAVQSDLWHRRFGHLGMDNLHRLSQGGLVTGMPALPPTPADHHCPVCDETKLTRSAFPTRTGTRAPTLPLDLLHMDLCSTGLVTHLGQRYVATITDDASRFSFVSLLRFKDGAGPDLEHVINYLETQTGRRVKRIRSDGGGEYINKAMAAFCSAKGIHQESTHPYSPQQNGVAERLNRTLLDKARAMMRDANLPLRYWGEAMQTANYLRNRSPSKHHGKTPYEVLFGRKPDVSHLRVFGCATSSLIPAERRANKIAPVAMPGQLLGYCAGKSGYKVLIHGAVHETRDVTFHEWDPRGRPAPAADPDAGDLAREEIEPAQQAAQHPRLPLPDDLDMGPDPAPARAPAPAPAPAWGPASPSGAAPSSPTGSAGGPPSPHTPRSLGAPTAAPEGGPPGAPTAPQRAISKRAAAAAARAAAPAPSRKSGRLAGEAPTVQFNLPKALDNLPPNMVVAPPPAAGPLGSPPAEAPGGPAPSEPQLEGYAANWNPTFLSDPSLDDGDGGQAEEWGGGPGDAHAHVVVDGVRIPLTRAEALASPEADRWIAAMADEWSSLVGMGTWTECPAPPGMRTIGVKWVFDLKTDSAGKIVRYKARLVAKGYSQVQGVDYTELFAPVSKYSTMRLLAALATHNDWHVHQLDVKTAFLHGAVEEELYIAAPEGHTVRPGCALRLNKSLYGLKQASRNWWKKLDALLVSLGGVASSADPCLYTIRRGGKVLYVLVYVDDCQLVSGDLELLTSVKQQLLDTFTMTDLGESTRFLGIDITRDRAAGTTRLSQAASIAALAETYGQVDSKPHHIPLPLGTVLEKSTAAGGPGGAAGTYPMAELVGSLNYIAQTTRPDIAYAVGALGRHTSSPTSEHWRAALHVLSYLYTTRHMGITYHRSPNSGSAFTVSGLCDADYGGDPGSRRSTTGYVFRGAGGAITWSSKLQPTVAASTTEAEYMAAAAAAKEGLWLRKALYDLGEPHSSMVIGCDNQAALAHIKNPIVSLRAKHVEIHHHFLRERVEMGQLHYHYVRTADNASDVLTKPLGPLLHKGCLEGLGME